jgi:phage gp29-like protein
MAEETTPPAVTEQLAQIADGRDITRGYVSALQLLDPQDTVLAARGRDYKVYEEVHRDDQVFSTFQQRRMAVVAQPWEVVPGGDDAIDLEAAEYLRATLKRISFDRVTNMMLHGVLNGYSVAECMWKQIGDFIELDTINVKKFRRFRFDGNRRLRLLTMQQPQGEEMPERKFWVFATGADNDDEPYGLGLAHWLYWPCFFKRFDVRVWLMFLEKFGLPTVVGKHPASASDAEKQKLLEAAEALQSDSAVTIPEGMMLELLEATRSGSADQAVFYDKMNAAISKIVLSQTMTTDDGASLSQAGVHLDVQQQVVKTDADLVCESFNAGPAKWLTEWNFPGAKLPQVWRQMPTAGKLAAQADLDKKVVDIGVARPTLKHIQDTYPGEWEAAPAPAPSPFETTPSLPASTSFAERRRALAYRDFQRVVSSCFAAPNDDDPAAALAEQLDDATSGAMDNIIDRVKEAVSDSHSFADLKDKLTELIADTKLDPSEIAGIMQQAFAVAELSGRADVDDEAKTGPKRG